MKVTSAPYSTKEYVKVCSGASRFGYHVTSSWLMSLMPGTQMSELTPEQHQKYAMRDEIDVREADVFVFFTDPTGTIVRGGRHVEFGMAVILGKPDLCGRQSSTRISFTTYPTCFTSRVGKLPKLGSETLLLTKIQ